MQDLSQFEADRIVPQWNAVQAKEHILICDPQNTDKTILAQNPRLNKNESNRYPAGKDIAKLFKKRPTWISEVLGFAQAVERFTRPSKTRHTIIESVDKLFEANKQKIAKWWAGGVPAALGARGKRRKLEESDEEESEVKNTIRRKDKSRSKGKAVEFSLGVGGWRVWMEQEAENARRDEERLIHEYELADVDNSDQVDD